MLRSETHGDVVTFDYDNNGNLLTSSDGKTYNYDKFNRLAEVTNVDGTWQTNVYGPDGLRIGILKNGTPTVL
jgi:YD repeat-containing protein